MGDVSTPEELPRRGLELEGVTVTFDGNDALSNVSLEVAPGEVAAVIGPSGSGKTTLLRVIAGLHTADAGVVSWNGERLDAVPPHRRGFGLMFQDYALFPHLTVERNIGFGLDMQKLPRERTTARVTEVLEMVGLTGFGARSVGSLSGGEQQRVALARTLAPAPRMVMLDEPIGALDRSLRDRLLNEMSDLFASLSLTVLYVTHDQDEAFSIADRVIVLRAGEAIRSGAPADVWRDPRSEFLARFFGFEDIYPVTVTNGQGDLKWMTLPIDRPDGVGTIALLPGAAAVDPLGAVPAIVRKATYRRGIFDAVVEVSEGLVVHVEHSTELTPGDAVRLKVDPERVAWLGS